MDWRGLSWVGCFLKLIRLFVNGEDMTSETESHVRFWAHRQLARDFFHDQKILSHAQFDAIDWKSVHHMLHSMP
jgi:hypothetical protein